MRSTYKLLIILAILLTNLAGYAQVPYSFNYQAVIRDTQGNVIANSVVDFSIDILQNGKIIYNEKHESVTTGTNGIVNFKIGEGTSPSSNFSSIDWSLGSYKIRISLNGELLGVSDIVAVPIALYAAHSGDNYWTHSDADNSLTYTAGMTEVQDLKIDGSSNLAAEAGMIRYDSSANDFIGYDGTEWKSLTQQGGENVWTFNSTNKSISYTDGLTQVQDLKINGNSTLAAQAGMLRYDATNKDFLGYNGSEWKSLTQQAQNTTTTVQDTLWNYNSSDKSITYTNGLTQVQDLKIAGNSSLAAQAGMIRYDATNKDFLGYNGSEWKSLTQQAQNTTTTVQDTLWTYNTSDKTVAYTNGRTELQELKIDGSTSLAASAGVIRYDTANNDFIGYNGTVWKSLTQQASTTTSSTEYISNETELKAAIAAKTSTLIIDASFTVSASVTISYAAKLESLGAAKTITTSGIDAIIISSSNVSVENLQLTSSSGGKAITLNSGISNIKLADLVISNYNYAIYKTGSESSTVLQNLTLNNIAVSSSKITGTEAAVTLQGNIANLNINTLNINSSAGTGLKIASGCTGSANNLIITDSKAGAIIISANTSSSYPQRRFSMDNVSITTCSGVGITIDQSAVSVSNVNVVAATGSGVKVNGSTSLVTPAQLSNIQISNTQVSGSYSYGISLYNNATANISNFYISGNSTTSTDATAIGVYASASQNFVVNGGVFMKVGKLISVN